MIKTTQKKEILNEVDVRVNSDKGENDKGETTNNNVKVVGRDIFDIMREGAEKKARKIRTELIEQATPSEHVGKKK